MKMLYEINEKALKLASEGKKITTVPPLPDGGYHIITPQLKKAELLELSHTPDIRVFPRIGARAIPERLCFTAITIVTVTDRTVKTDCCVFIPVIILEFRKWN